MKDKIEKVIQSYLFMIVVLFVAAVSTGIEILRKFYIGEPFPLLLTIIFIANCTLIAFVVKSMWLNRRNRIDNQGEG